MRPVGAGRQSHAEPVDGQDGARDGAHRPLSLGLSASFNPCPTKDTARTVTRMAIPGMAETYHCTCNTSRPRPIKLPQDATFGSERWRKASALSSRIATAITTLA